MGGPLGNFKEDLQRLKGGPPPLGAPNPKTWQKHMFGLKTKVVQVILGSWRVGKDERDV